MRYITRPRTVALLLSLCLLCASLAGCGKARPIEATEEDLTVIGTVGTYEVLYEELRFLTCNYRDAMEATYGEGIWDNEQTREQYRAELEDAVYGNITANYAVLSLCDEVLIRHDDPIIEDAVQADIAELVTQFGSRREYKNQLAAEYLTDHLLRFNLAVNICENELMYAYIDDLGLIPDDEEEIFDIIMSDAFARTLHIYIENNEGESVEENRALAHDVLAQLNEGASFTTMIGRHSEDFYMTTTNGYYFTRGEMIDEYEQAAFALEVGQYSEVIETATGFYIIQRLPQDREYVDQNLAALIDQYQYAMLYNMIDARQEELSINLNDYCKSLDLTTIS